MIKSYWINKNPLSINANHEIHKIGCIHLAKCRNKAYLGDFASDQRALAFAKWVYPRYKYIDGCAYCCNSIHKR